MDSVFTEKEVDLIIRALMTTPIQGVSLSTMNQLQQTAKELSVLIDKVKKLGPSAAEPSKEPVNDKGRKHPVR